MSNAATVMTTAPAVDVTPAIDGYLAIWNEPDPERRSGLIARYWSDDGVFIDPFFSARGSAEFSAVVAAVGERFPLHRLRLLGPVDSFGDRARFSWGAYLPDAREPDFAGVDFAIMAPDGRLAAVTGFFDTLPS